jgi:hypothetical protein
MQRVLLMLQRVLLPQCMLSHQHHMLHDMASPLEEQRDIK